MVVKYELHKQCLKSLQNFTIKWKGKFQILSLQLVNYRYRSMLIKDGAKGKNKYLRTSEQLKKGF
jgi:hypothetical protein